MPPSALSKFGSIVAVRKTVHFHSLTVQGVSAAFGTITFLCYIRWMDTASVGLLVLFITAVTVVDMLRSGFLQPGLVRFSSVDQEEERKSILGSSFLLGLLWTGGVSLLVAAAIPFIDLLPGGSGVSLFVFGLPLLYLTTYPGRFATWKAQAELRFDRILAYRCLVSSSVLIGVVLTHILAELSPGAVVAVFTISSLIGSSFVTAMGWISLRDISHSSMESAMKLIRFGRYSMTTQLGASLLKSSDTFIIGAFLGPSSVAIYGLAQKVSELLELPLRALSASVYPIMAKQGMRRNFRKVGRIIEQVTGGYLLALCIPAIILFFSSDFLISIFSNEAYGEAGGIVRIFIVAAMVLPLDRMVGIGLDSLGRPNYNMVKVLLMLLLNVVGDLIAIHFFGTLYSVALVTVFMTCLGVILGTWWLRPDVHVSLAGCATAGLRWLNPTYLRLQIEKSKLQSDSCAV